MKKFSISLLLVLASLVFVVNGCKKVNCTDLAQKVTDTALDYAMDPTTANCQAYADAIRKYIDKCTVANRAYYDAMLEDLNCGK
jgi:hypothetical protein